MHNKIYKITKPLTRQLPFEKDKWFDNVQIRLFHSTGGVNYMTGATQSAGWYISFAPVHIEKHDEYETTSTELFHKRAFKIFCNKASRFSAKRFEALKIILDKNVDHITKLYDEQKDKELYLFIQDTFGEIK